MSPPVICQETGKECLHYDDNDICQDHSKCSILNNIKYSSPDPSMTKCASAIDAKRNNVESVGVRTKEYKEGQCEWRDICYLTFISYENTKDFLTYKCADAAGNVYIICSGDIECYTYKEDLSLPQDTS